MPAIPVGGEDVTTQILHTWVIHHSYAVSVAVAMISCALSSECVFAAALVPSAAAPAMKFWKDVVDASKEAVL